MDHQRKPPKKSAASNAAASGAERRGSEEAAQATATNRDAQSAAAPALAARLAALFAGNERAHGTHGAPDEREPGELKWSIKKTARTIKSPPTPALWEQHVAGERPLGVIPIRDDDLCSWGSIDIDEYDANLLAIVERVEAAKLPLVPCVSKSGGLHLFLFLPEAEQAAAVQAALQQAATALGMAECEIFPKQTKLDLSAVGNWMVMPYFGDTFGSKLRLQRGLKKTGAEMTLAEFVAYAERRRTALAQFAALAAKAAPAKPRARGRATGGDDFADGPPCLQTLAASGAQGDGRKRTLFMMAVYFKKRDPSSWKEDVARANLSYFKPPLPSDEVTGVVRSAGKKNYHYTCKTEPMCSVCDASLCRTRPFGVGGGASSSPAPVFDSVVIYEADETTWEILIEGKKITVSSDEMLDQQAFNRRCAAQLHHAFAPMKRAEWIDFFNETAKNAEKKKAAPGVDRASQFRELLTEFLLNRARGDRREDLLRGVPWLDVDAARHYFRLKDLKNFIERDRASIFRGASLGKLGGLIRGQGGGPTDITVNHRSLFVFWVPRNAIEEPLPSPPRTLPPDEGDT